MEPVCEGSEANFGCLDGRVIHIVSAMYGRQDNMSCPHVTISDTNCSHVDSLQTVTTRCQGNQYCRFTASNAEFGSDPCPDTVKYLDVTYHCIILQGL